MAAEIESYLAACWSMPGAESGVLSLESRISGPKTQAPDRLKPALRPQDFLNLFLAETFINRNRGED